MNAPRLVVALVLLAPLGGCAELVGASIEAGFRDLTDHGKHPLYPNKSYGEHFVDALVEETTPTPDVTVVLAERRHRH